MNRLARNASALALTLPLLFLLRAILGGLVGSEHAAPIAVVMFPCAFWSGRLLIARWLGAITRRIRWPFHPGAMDSGFTIWGAERLDRSADPRSFQAYMRSETLVFMLVTGFLLANLVGGHVADRFR